MKFISFLLIWLLTLLEVQSISAALSGALIKSRCPAVEVAYGRVRTRSRGRVARIKCKPTYILVGAKILTCIRNTWDYPPPICIKSGSVACDFERDLCGWTQDNYNFNWIRQSHNTPSGHIGTGPSFDHTLGIGRDGHYMYIESSTQMENDTARLLSPVFGPELSRNACFIFWYHMFGATTGTLRTSVRLLNDGDGNITTIFSKSGNQGNRWYGSLTQITQVDQPFQIIIEGIRGRGYSSDIAIDDVKLASGEDCELATVAPTESFIQTTLVTSSPSIADSATVAQRTPRPFPTYLPPPPPPPLPPLSPNLTVMTSPAPPYPYTPIYTTMKRQDYPSTSDVISSEKYPETTSTDTDGSTVITEKVSVTTVDTTTQATTKPSIKTTIVTEKTTLSSTQLTKLIRITETPTTTKTTPLPTSSLPTSTRDAFVPLPATKQHWTRTTTSLFISSVVKAPAPSPHTKGIVIITSAVILVAVLAAIVIFVAARRRIKLKRRNDMAEDSDVRFLTSDEVLDFNLARPFEDEL